MPKTPEEIREQSRLRSRAHYQANKARYLERTSAYSKAHREQYNAYNRAYYKADPEKFRARRRDYHARNMTLERQKSLCNFYARIDHYRAKARAWRAAHLERARASVCAYIKANSARLRSRKDSALINDLTVKQWQKIKEHYGYRCVYCHRQFKQLTQDHITPLSKGGDHTLTNIVPACRSCNSRKHAGPPLKPVQPLLLEP